VTLLKLRNPWGQEEYLGPWSDSSNLWTDYTKSQVDYLNSNNGEFYIDLDTFVTEFGTYDISFYEPGMQKSLFYVDHFDWDKTYSFMFTLQEDQHFVSVNTGQPGSKFYAPGCNPSLSMGFIELYEPTNWGWSRIDYMWTYNSGGSISVEFDDLPAGEYKIQVEFMQGSS
jgi:hypothetical protein